MELANSPKSDKASVFVDKLSWMLRATLQQSEKNYLTLQEELDYLEAYIFLQKERFGDKLKIEINIPDAWKKQTVPSFSVQLLVENAIKHNVIANRQP
ncbi:MAG: histidine kinase, partial [Bacteroidota bacterium]